MPKTGEFELIENIRKMFPTPAGVTGIGDDAAVIGGSYLVTTDALCEGTHFITGKTDFTDLGYKSMAVNVSDIAAMGGKPLYALLTLGLTSRTTDSQVSRLLAGMKECADEFSFSLVGGDTVKSKGLLISITLIGLPFGKPLLRSGAKEGDRIYVSGTLGDSAIGLDLLLKKSKFTVKDRPYFLSRHNKPSPRIKLAEYLVSHHTVHSCIDCSDGLLADLGHIGEMSGKGFRVELDRLPVSSGKIGKPFDKNRERVLELACGGGEDYELIFTSPDKLDTKEIEKNTGIRVTEIGLITGIAGDRNITLNGNPMDINKIRTGFRHF
jgi:thiamine-monophosphate kinase